MKDGLGGQVIKELRTKTYSYLKDNKDEDKKSKRQNKKVSWNKKKHLEKK